MTEVTELPALRRENDILQRKLIDLTLSEVIADPRLGVAPSARDDILNRAYSIWMVDAEATLIPKIKGVTLCGADGVSPMSPREWVASLRERSRHLFRGEDADSPKVEFGGLSRSEFERLDPLEKLQLANRRNPDDG